MKNLLTFVFGLLATLTFGQTIELQWKIGTQEKLNYLTVMNEIDTSSVEVDFGDFSKLLSDSTGNDLSKFKDIFKDLNKSMQKKMENVSTLTNKGNGTVDILMMTRPKEGARQDSAGRLVNEVDKLLSMMESANQGVMLRGSVYANGGIHSFWIKDSQKNLISIFFELPTKPLKLGDTWSIDVNLIANDQNFSCDSAYKINEVKLTDIKKNKDETIAVIQYNIVEYVSGTFSSPLFFGGNPEQKTMMKFTHQAIAEFSVDRGRWISYDGIMSLDATGVMTAKQKTRFALTSE